MLQNLIPSMTKEQFDTMPGYRAKDIALGLGIPMGQAYKLMREIKSISNITGLVGYILRDDWDNYKRYIEEHSTKMCRKV